MRVGNIAREPRIAGDTGSGGGKVGDDFVALMDGKYSFLDGKILTSKEIIIEIFNFLKANKIKSCIRNIPFLKPILKTSIGKQSPVILVIFSLEILAIMLEPGKI